MSWIIPENKLDEQQRDFVENVDINQRNVWIKGFPGSGKSVGCSVHPLFNHYV